MNQGSGFILIILGLLLLYVVITGKFAIVEHAFYQLFGLEEPPDDKANRAFERGIEQGRVMEKTGQATGITLPQIFIPDYTK